MVAKWVALSILIGLGVVMIPIVVVILWTISKVMFAALLIFALVIGLIMIVLAAIDHDIQIKKQNEKDDEEWK